MKFNQVVMMRWLSGRSRRGLSHLDPFEGDPVREFEFKTADLANLLEEMKRRGMVGEAVEREVSMILVNLWMMAQTAGSSPSEPIQYDHPPGPS